MHYDSFDEVLADAERLAAIDTKTLGNWSLGQIASHLATSINMMIDGANFKMPFPMQLVMRLLMKKKMLRQTLPPGFQIPKSASSALPAPIEVDTALEQLRAAVCPRQRD